MRPRLQRNLTALILAGALAGFTGCAGTVYVPAPPPAPRAEVQPSCPGPDVVWVKGHWKWNGRKYKWVDGHWAKQRNKGHWVSGHWAKRPRGWVWVPGHWK
jgi:hypothetical protein